MCFTCWGIRVGLRVSTILQKMWFHFLMWCYWSTHSEVMISELVVHWCFLIKGYKVTRDKRSLEGDGRGGTEQGAYVFFALPSCNIMNMWNSSEMNERRITIKWSCNCKISYFITQSPCWILAMCISLNHGCAWNLTLDMLQLYMSLGSVTDLGFFTST